MGENIARSRGIRDYVAAQTPEVQHEIAEAGEILDIALLLRRARVRRGMTQAQAAEAAEMQQQAVSRFERAEANTGIETLGAYLNALGYEVDLRVREPKTGTVIGTLPIGGQHTKTERGRARRPRSAGVTT